MCLQGGRYDRWETGNIGRGIIILVVELMLESLISEEKFIMNKLVNYGVWAKIKTQIKKNLIQIEDRN